MLFLFAALQTPPQQNFPAINRPGTFADLRGSVERACHVTSKLDVNALLDRERRAAWDVHGTRVPADAWLTLGCARAILAGERSPASPGPLMDAGNSWAQGAERVMQEVLKARPADIRAVEVLGLLALDDNDPDDLSSAATSLVVAVEHGAITPPILRACAELTARTRAEASSRRCSEEALHAGYDSTWHLMRLAQLAFRGCDTVAGNRWFILAAGVARDSLARQEVNWHLQWFLSPAEMKEWPSVADANRSTWLRDRIVARDVRDGQPFGARIAEHFGRLDYVEANFRLQVSRRTREALRTGPNMDDSATLDNDKKILATCEAGMILATEFRFYPRWQTDFDDRGVIWMRFGAPTRRVRSNPSCRLPDNAVPTGASREIWLYEIDGQRMLLNFEYEMYSGSQEATRLVEGVLGSYMCEVDAKRCGLTELSFAMAVAKTPPQTALVQPEDVVHLHQEDAAYISAATTQDDNSPRGEKNVAIVSRLHRLWDPLSNASIALVTYALPIKELAVQRETQPRTTSLRLELRQWDPSADRWNDTSFVRHFELPDTSLKRPNIVGFIATPSTPGVTAWSLVATQSGRRGRAYDVKTPGLASGSTELSDLVLGADAQGVIWNFHNVAIPLAPSGTLDRKLPVSLYYQVRSAADRSDLRTTVAVYRVDGGVAADSAALQVTYDQGVRKGINEVAPGLDLSRLDKGSYTLEVRLADASGVVIARRRAPLELY